MNREGRVLLILCIATVVSCTPPAGPPTALSADADLISLTLAKGSLSPAFEKATTEYEATLRVATTTVTATASDSANATIQARTNGGVWEEIESGQRSGAVSLGLGDNTIEVLVTAEDGTHKTYSIDATRVPLVLRVAVESGSSSTASAVEIAAQLNDDSWYDCTAVIVTSNQIDAASELANYDVVIFGDSGAKNNDWNSAMADSLAAWVSAGYGGVLSVGFADWAVGTGTYHETLDTLMPIDATASAYDSSLATCTLRITTSHAVTSGIADFSLPTSTMVEYAHGAPDATGAQVLAVVESASCTSSAPRNTVVIGELGLGRIAYLGLPYLANAVTYTNIDLRSGSPDRLLEQALAWVSSLTD